LVAINGFRHGAIKSTPKELIAQLSICTCGFSCLMLKVYYCSFGDLSFSVWSWTAIVCVFLEDILRNNFFSSDFEGIIVWILLYLYSIDMLGTT